MINVLDDTSSQLTNGHQCWDQPCPLKVTYASKRATILITGILLDEDWLSSASNLVPQPWAKMATDIYIYIYIERERGKQF